MTKTMTRILLLAALLVGCADAAPYCEPGEFLATCPGEQCAAFCVDMEGNAATVAECDTEGLPVCDGDTVAVCVCDP